MAIELNSDLILLDDFEARETAKSLGLKITGVVGSLLDAKNVGIVTSVKEKLDNLIECNFRISKSLYHFALKEAGE